MIVSFLPDLKSFMAIFLVSIGCFALLGTLIFRETKEFANTVGHDFGNHMGNKGIL